MDSLTESATAQPTVTSFTAHRFCIGGLRDRPRDYSEGTHQHDASRPGSNLSRHGRLQRLVVPFNKADNFFFPLSIKGGNLKMASRIIIGVDENMPFRMLPFADLSLDRQPRGIRT